MTTVRSLTDQNLSRHSAWENKMLLNIELSRERIRDVERRIADSHSIVQVRAERRSRRSFAGGVMRFRHILTKSRV